MLENQMWRFKKFTWVLDSFFFVFLKEKKISILKDSSVK
jgi:hypothetical protein